MCVKRGGQLIEMAIKECLWPFCEIFGHKKSASPYTGDTLFFVLVYAIARLNKRSSLHRDRSIESLINKLSKPIKTASERRAYRSAS